MLEYHVTKLNDLFEQRRKLETELRETDELIKEHGRCYWLLQGYTVMPRIEKLKAAILGASNKV